MDAINTESGNSEQSESYCISFLCDEKYLFPTLVAAKQAAKHAPAGADVVIFLDSQNIAQERLEAIERLSELSVRLVPDWLRRLLDERVPEGFFKTHVSRAALFRLFVGKLLEKRYDKIVYMDGDVQVRRPLAPLLATVLPAGHVAAAPDWVALHSVEGMPHMEENRAYLRGLEMSPTQWGSYFNSGVMMAAPETWNTVGAEALDFLVNNPGACRLHDQSALNHACRDGVVALSLRWNYLRQFMSLAAFDAIDPAIVHFVGKLKPWDGAYEPWGRAEFQPYVDMARALRGSGVAWSRQPLARRIAYHFRPFFKKDEYADRDYRARLNRALRTHSLPPPAPEIERDLSPFAA